MKVQQSHNQSERPVLQLRRGRGQRLLWTALAVVAIATVAIYALLGLGEGKFDYAKADALYLAERAKWDTVPRPTYEYGRPIADLSNPARLEQDFPTTGGKGTQSSVKQRIAKLRADHNQLKQIHAGYQQRPTEDLKKQGLELKQKVQTELNSLMKLAHHYNYTQGLQEGEQMQRELNEMSF